MQRLCEGRGRQHPDIAVYGGKGGSRSFHVEEVRQIRDSAAVMPNEAQAKVYILDGADHMTEQAQNALLKVLEEPPSYVIFLLTCGAASSLLPTVRSRAQIFRVQKEDNPQTEESEAFLRRKAWPRPFHPPESMIWFPKRER